MILILLLSFEMLYNFITHICTLCHRSYSMDHFNSREGEEPLFDMILGGGGPLPYQDGALVDQGGEEDCGAEDGSQFLNESGEGIEIKPQVEAHTSFNFDDGLENDGPAFTKSGEVYY